jgi:hypothetical protein
MTASAGSRQHLAPSGEPGNLYPERGLLVDFAMQGSVQRFPEFDPAAGQRIKALARRARPPHQQDLAVAKDRGADGELGMRRRRSDQAMIQKGRNRWSDWSMPDRPAKV